MPGWSPEQDELLNDKIEELGTSWVLLIKFFPGRSANDIKNRYYSQQRKLARRSSTGEADDDAETHTKPSAAVVVPRSKYMPHIEVEDPRVYMPHHFLFETSAAGGKRRLSGGPEAGSNKKRRESGPPKGLVWDEALERHLTDDTRLGQNKEKELVATGAGQKKITTAGGITKTLKYDQAFFRRDAENSLICLAIVEMI